MFEVRQTQVFIDWLSALDETTKAIIAARIARFADGQMGDHKAIGDGVSELRIHAGAGYRIYYARRGQLVYLLLCGGDKGSQQRDIKRAMKMIQEL